jgi:hypothetical protein
MTRGIRMRPHQVFKEFIGGKVGRRFIMAVAILVLMVASAANAAVPVAISDQGWTITASPELGTLSVRHERLGLVLQNVRLSLQGEHGLSPLTEWSVAESGQSSLTLHSVHPIASWTFEISSDCLKISNTLASAVLMAEAPAPLNRIPARPLDPRGTPVEWVGTNEAMLEYGGAETSNQSFLPSTNPEVMYFAMGLVSASTFHALFDRNTDTVIQFTDQTSLRRSDRDEDLLDVKMPIPGNATIRLVPEYYTKVLGVPFYAPLDDTYFSTAPMVWSSWTGYYEDVTENDIVRNTDWLARNLAPYGFQVVQLDDGYDRGKNGEHAWIENWDKSKFPHGPQWLTSYIKSKGMRAGLWLVPNAYAGAIEEHPNWYVRSKDGELVTDYNTSVLDSSNPEVLAFLKKLFTTLDDWGFEYYKFDGEGSIPQAMSELERKKLYRDSSDPVAVYRDRLKTIRGAVGPRVFLEGCPAGMPLHGVGYFNSYFNGNDLYDNWQGMYPLFSSINGNAFFNHIFAYVMPGEGLELGNPMTLEQAKARRAQGVLREISNRETPVTGVGVTDAEARTLVSFISLTGVAYPVGNVMPDLPAERLKLLQQTMPTMPIIPLDLFSRGTDNRNKTFQRERPDYYIHNYPEILDLKVTTKSEAYDVVGLTNWRSETATRKISLIDKLGLDGGSSHIIFDFWNQKLLGVFGDEMKIEIEPHDTRVLSIHPALNRPQLIGNSRHVSGVYSILDEKWDDTKNTLSGVSKSVPHEPYTLWFYVPKGVTVASIGVTTKDDSKIPAQTRLQDNSLMVSIEGRSEPVTWTVSFAGAPTK